MVYINETFDLTCTNALSFLRFFLFFWAFINILTGTLDGYFSLFVLFLINTIGNSIKFTNIIVNIK